MERFFCACDPVCSDLWSLPDTASLLLYSRCRKTAPCKRMSQDNRLDDSIFAPGPGTGSWPYTQAMMPGGAHGTRAVSETGCYRQDNTGCDPGRSNYLLPEVFKKRAKPFRLRSYLAIALGESENFLLNSIVQGGSEKRSSISAFFFPFG